MTADWGNGYSNEWEIIELFIEVVSCWIYYLIRFASIVSSLQNNNGSQKISGDQLKDLYKSFVSEYPIVSIEDPFDQDDWETYAKLIAEIGAKVPIVGDDLLVTNPKVKLTPDTTSCPFLLGRAGGSCVFELISLYFWKLYDY